MMRRIGRWHRGPLGAVAAVVMLAASCGSSSDRAGTPSEQPVLSESCLATDAIEVRGDQPDDLRLPDHPGAAIDARLARWEGLNAYPIDIGGAPGGCFHGGVVRGAFDDDLSWDEFHRTGAVSFSAAQFVVEGVNVENYGDGIRIEEGGDAFTVRDVHLRTIRDDCIENDHLAGGVVSNAFLDGCYVAFSARPAPDDGDLPASDEVWAIEGSLIRLQPMPGVFKGPSPGHGGFFKWDERGPRLRLHDNVFRADQLPNHNDLGLPTDKIESCSGNVMVWLGDGPYPDPLPGCFTVTTDEAVWERAVAAWAPRCCVEP